MNIAEANHIAADLGIPKNMDTAPKLEAPYTPQKIHRSARIARKLRTRVGPSPVVFDRSTLEKARWCRQRLLTWFAHNGREFPWRSADVGVFEQVVSELLLQRTQALTVGKFFDSFFGRFKSWDDIDSASVEVVEEALRPIGLWRRRATALKAFAREMVLRGGNLPSSRNELEKMPAVGQYVASAVLLFAHGRPEPLLDVNMARVLDRVFKPRRLVDFRYDANLQDLARLLVRSRRPAQVNWAVLDLAAINCSARSPACEPCPLRARCNFVRGGSLHSGNQDNPG